MSNFVGIDLGTTNSAICSFNGSETRIWKSPEQNDVTPSVIHIDRRGNKYIGKRAYDSAPHSPDNSAMLFKRLMGTNTPVRLAAVNLTKTPEECSAEILKVLFGYLPEEIRIDADTGTVITVPAAFNQMQKDATMQAASMAGIGKVTLMQEPVAAVMKVMRLSSIDGMFMIYDLGGGTLDIAIAESIGGRVNLLAHGGIAMCGGRDFDRVLFDNVVRSWLHENFYLPKEMTANPEFKSLIRLAIWATERAKIELSSREEAAISLSETDTRVRDLKDNEIYLDIPLSRGIYDELIAKRVVESIESARETMAKVGLSSHDFERIVFVGGPTNYKPLRDKVAFELGIPGSTDVNPMTAVAEGASLFSESIDWDSHNRSRKNSRGQISPGGGLAVTFNYIARTPDPRAKIAIDVAGQTAIGFEIQIDSIDTGWTSGLRPLEHGAIIEVNLTNIGENAFKVFVFDSIGEPIRLEHDKITITKTAVTVEAIPASHSIGIEVLEQLGGRPVLEYLVRSGETLPKRGKRILRAAESLMAGASHSLNFKLWEGDIDQPIGDNRPIGVLKITGSDFDDGVIPVGADLECDYEILDSGNVAIEVSVPCIGGTFRSGRNFYSRQEGQFDFTSDAVRIVEEGENTLKRIDEINRVVDDTKLDQARQNLEPAISLDPEEADTEEAQEAMEKVFEAKKLIAGVRKAHRKQIRQVELDGLVSFFNEFVRKHSRLSEATAFDSLAKTAQRSIDRNDIDFENHLDQLRGKSFEILWRQDWFVVEQFKSMNDLPHLFADKRRSEELANTGEQLIRSNEIDKLRDVVAEQFKIRIDNSPDDDMFGATTNIIRG